MANTMRGPDLGVLEMKKNEEECDCGRRDGAWQVSIIRGGNPCGCERSLAASGTLTQCPQAGAAPTGPWVRGFLII